MKERLHVFFSLFVLLMAFSYMLVCIHLYALFRYQCVKNRSCMHSWRPSKDVPLLVKPNAHSGNKYPNYQVALGMHVFIRFFVENMKKWISCLCLPCIFILYVFIESKLENIIGEHKSLWFILLSFFWLVGMTPCNQCPSSHTRYSMFVFIICLKYNIWACICNHTRVVSIFHSRCVMIVMICSWLFPAQRLVWLGGYGGFGSSQLIGCFRPR